MHQRYRIILAAILVFLASSAPGETFVVRAPAGVKAAPAELLGSQAVGERFCNTLHCVVYASHGDEKTRISALAAGRSIALEALPDADKLFFQHATFDVPSSRFESPFPGDQDAGPHLSVGQFVVVFKSHPTSEWLYELRKRGLTPLEAIPTMGYLVYGPREAVSRLTAFEPVRAVVPMSPGIKRFNVDELLPGDDDLPRMTTVVAVTDHLALVTDLLRGASGVEPIISTPSPTVTSLIAPLGRMDAFNLSRLPEVVSVRRNTDTAGPSDERANRIIGGSWQTPDTSWPLTLPGNSSTPKYWDGFLAQLGPLGTAPNTVDYYLRSQTIGILDTGIDGGLQETGAGYCPPFLRDTAGNCRLVFTQDVTRRWQDQNTLGDDFYYHGSLTASIAGGFASSASPGRDTGQYAFTQGVAQGAPVGMVNIFSLCDPENGGHPYRDWNGDGFDDFSEWDMATRVRYAIAELSHTAGDLPDAFARNTISPAATLFNHSWNDKRVVDYTEVARILDRATRRLNTVSYSFPGSGQVITGASGAATASLHVVSAGNIYSGTLQPPPPDYYLVETPGTAKNVITVGATENYNQEAYTAGCGGNNPENADNPRTIGGFSRIGFSNQRLKPDLVAPGTRSYGFRSIHLTSPCNFSTACNMNLLNGSTDPRYGWANGTSFSAPAVTGAVALTRAWLQALRGGASPSPALLKATLIATSRNIAPCATGCASCSSCSYCGDMRPAPDKYQGWGGVSLDRLFRPATNYFFLEQGQPFTGTGQAWSQTLSIVDRTKAIGIALVWTDRWSIDTVHTGQNLTNDLDLEVSYVYGGATHRYYGNNFYTSIDSCNRDGFSMLDPTPAYDRKNNVEKVLIRGEEIPVGVTQITLRVSSFALTGDGVDPDGATNRQDFALMVENAR